MINAIIYTNPGMACQHTVMTDGSACADFNIPINNGIGSNTDVYAQFGARINNRRGMNRARHYAIDRMVHNSSASQASLPST